jgi:hypothetical protein
MHLTLTKQGRIEFPEYKRGLTKVRLVSATVYNSFNITETVQYTRNQDSRIITLPKGHYTYEEIVKQIGADEISVNKNTLKVLFSGVLEGGLQNIYDNDTKLLYLRPNALYVYLNQLDTRDNYINGENSDLLSVLYLDNSKDIGDISIYHVNTDMFKKLATTEKLNHIDVSIRDAYDKDYTGRFVLNLELI